jgi:hypothetical protein
MRVRRSASLTVLPALASLAGCTGYAPPRLEVTDARIVETSPDATVVRFTFEAENPNESELPLREIRYSVWIEGREVFGGIRSPESTLRRLGAQSFTIPAVIAAAEAPAPAASYTIEGTLVYITPGSFAQVLFETGVRRPSVGFRHEGTLAPAAGPDGPAGP